MQELSFFPRLSPRQPRLLPECTLEKVVFICHRLRIGSKQVDTSCHTARRYAGRALAVIAPVSGCFHLLLRSLGDFPRTCKAPGITKGSNTDGAATIKMRSHSSFLCCAARQGRLLFHDKCYHSCCVVSAFNPCPSQSPSDVLCSSSCCISDTWILPGQGKAIPKHTKTTATRSLLVLALSLSFF